MTFGNGNRLASLFVLGDAYYSNFGEVVATEDG